MEKTVKALPITTDSIAKGYIMYNPAKFDIIPVTKPATESKQDSTGPFAEVSPLTSLQRPQNIGPSNPKQTRPIYTTLLKSDPKLGPFSAIGTKPNDPKLNASLVGVTFSQKPTDPKLPSFQNFGSKDPKYSGGPNFGSIMNETPINEKTHDPKFTQNASNEQKSGGYCDNFGSRLNDPNFRSKMNDPKFTKNISNEQKSGSFCDNFGSMMNDPNFRTKMNDPKFTQNASNEQKSGSFCNNFGSMMNDPNFRSKMNDPKFTQNVSNEQKSGGFCDKMNDPNFRSKMNDPKFTQNVSNEQKSGGFCDKMNDPNFRSKMNDPKFTQNVSNEQKSGGFCDNMNDPNFRSKMNDPKFTQNVSNEQKSGGFCDKMNDPNFRSKMNDPKFAQNVSNEQKSGSFCDNFGPMMNDPNFRSKMNDPKFSASFISKINLMGNGKLGAFSAIGSKMNDPNINGSIGSFQGAQKNKLAAISSYSTTNDGGTVKYKRPIKSFEENPLQGIESVLKKCEVQNIETAASTASVTKEETSFTTVFKDIHSILNGDATEIEELDPIQDDYKTNDVESDEQLTVDINDTDNNSETDLLTVKDEPLSPRSQQIDDDITDEDQSSSMSVEGLFGGTYKDIRSGLSDGEHTSNSGDNFEMVMVKCEPEETHGFFAEAPSSGLLRQSLSRRKQISQKRRQERKNESVEERARRLIQVRDAARFRRQRETDEQRMERLRKDREKKRKYRAKMKEDDTYEEMLAKNRVIMRIRRQDEAYREKERERDRIRHQIRRANHEYRQHEKVKERERKRLSRFLKKYAEQYSTFQQFAQQMFCPPQELNMPLCSDSSSVNV